MDFYERKLSVDEEKRHYVFVTKDAAGYFPRNTEFKIKVGNLIFKSRLEVTPCECVGPKHPHEHYKILLSPHIPIKKGNHIILQRVAHDEFIAKLTKKKA